MIKIYQKKSSNKAYFHLGERIRVGKKNYTLQVYLGKSVPKNLAPYYEKLAKKERLFVTGKLQELFHSPQERHEIECIEKIENSRIDWKYHEAQLSDAQRDRFWRNFAIQFIFESNSIEGSRLTQSEVEKIIRKRRIPKKIDRQEVREVENSLRSFHYIQSDAFRLNQRCIKELHAMITENLGYDQGYKKRANIVNLDTVTTKPGNVRSALAHAIKKHTDQKKSKRHPFLAALDFHATFEHIHPFQDGNGRTGRMILIWMLAQEGYGTLLIRKKNRQKYWNALKKADQGKNEKWHRFAADTYKKTISEITKPS